MKTYLEDVAVIGVTESIYPLWVNGSGNGFLMRSLQKSEMFEEVTSLSGKRHSNYAVTSMLIVAFSKEHMKVFSEKIMNS